MKKITAKDLDKMGSGAAHKAKERSWIKVGLSTCGIAAGADEVYATLVDEVKKRAIDVDIKRCGCQGACFAEPMLEVHVKGLPNVLYGKVNQEGALKILEKHVCAGLLVKDYIYELRIKR